MKTCTKCGENKPETAFYAHAGGKHGLYSQCKVCRRAYARNYARDYVNNPQVRKRKNARLRDSRAAKADPFEVFSENQPRPAREKPDDPVTSPLTEDEKERWRKQFANAGK